MEQPTQREQSLSNDFEHTVRFCTISLCWNGCCTGESSNVVTPHETAHGTLPPKKNTPGLQESRDGVVWLALSSEWM